MVDLAAGCVHAYREPSPTGYREAEHALPGDSLTIAALPGLSLLVADVLGAS